MDEHTREEILATASARMEALITTYLGEVEKLRVEIEQITGVSLTDPVPRPRNYPELTAQHVAIAREQCRQFEEAARLLEPLFARAPDRTVGALLKTCEAATGARIRDHLEACGFFGASLARAV